MNSFLSLLLLGLLDTDSSLFNFGFDGLYFLLLSGLFIQTSLFFFIFGFFGIFVFGGGLLLQIGRTPLMLDTSTGDYSRLLLFKVLAGPTISNFAVTFD